MESSGSYNMGFANLVGNCYSKHPLKDYSGNAFVVDNSSLVTVTNDASLYDPTVTYSYYNHKGNLKNTAEDDLKVLSSAEEFALGPRLFAKSKNITKVLGGIGDEVSYSDDAIAAGKASDEYTNV